jgi:hypothetical protein
MSSRAQLLYVSPVLLRRPCYPQRQSIVPTCGKVPYFDFIVARRLPLTPQQETLLRTQTLLVDVANSEA